MILCQHSLWMISLINPQYIVLRYQKLQRQSYLPSDKLLYQEPQDKTEFTEIPMEDISRKSKQILDRRKVYI